MNDVLPEFVTNAAGIDGDGRPVAPVGAGAGNTPAIRPLNLWRPSQFLEWQEPAGNHLLLPAFLTKGSLTTLIGQGGLGKSRLALGLAICQILGHKWCGIETHSEPVKWVFLGDENSVARWKDDLTRMFSLLSPEDRAIVDEFLLLPAGIEADDCDVWMSDPATIARIALTIQQTSPGVVVGDPLANFAPGDIAKPGDMKEAVRLFTGTIRREAPLAATLLLHHARTGRANIAQGVGFDAANFGMGGKALFSSARCQMNLMPGDENDDSKLVLHCAKSNNCQRFAMRGIIFDRDTFTYSVDPDFDAETWKAKVEGRATSGGSLYSVADVVAAVRDGYTTTKDLVAHLCDVYAASKRTAERLITKTVVAGGIQQFTRGKFILGRKAEKLLAQ